MARNEIVFKDRNAAFRVAELLLDEEYVVMFSKEENFTIINYEWSENDANRNDVVFMRRDEFEGHYQEIVNEDDITPL